MVSPEQKRQRMRLLKKEAERMSVKRSSRGEIEHRLYELSLQVKAREAVVDGWRAHVQSFLQQLDEEFGMQVGLGLG